MEAEISRLAVEASLHAREGLIIAVFAVCYLGMILGELPHFKLDRTGIALICALLLLGSKAISESEAIKAIHVPTLALLFGLMIVSAQLQLGGFYAKVTAEFSKLKFSPSFLLLSMMVTMGLLSALFSNDVICLVTAPIIIAICRRKGITPVPYLLGLACSSNIGSALTLIGNPQNMLIAQTLRLSFLRYTKEAAPIVFLSLVVAWAIIALRWRGNWLLAEDRSIVVDESIFKTFDKWQTIKGIMVATVLMILFLGEWWPRELCALGAAGFLLMSRHIRSHYMLGFVDWQLLVLFISLFIVNQALYQTGFPQMVVTHSAKIGINLHNSDILFGLVVLLSNIVSNVPAVMLLLPWTDRPEMGHLLAIASTFAGNLFIGGSIANIIVVNQAAKAGINISWREHARIGIPVTLITLAIARIIMLFK